MGSGSQGLECQVKGLDCILREPQRVPSRGGAWKGLPGGQLGRMMAAAQAQVGCVGLGRGGHK